MVDWGAPHLTSLDAYFTMEEVLEAAGHLQDHKATGEDGIVGEWMKVMLAKDHSQEMGGRGEPSLMAKVVLNLFNAVWRQGYIPSCWRRAMVISVRKVTPWIWIITGASLLYQSPLRCY